MRKEIQQDVRSFSQPGVDALQIQANLIKVSGNAVKVALVDKGYTEEQIRMY